MRLGRIRKEAIAALTQVPEIKRQVRRAAVEVREEARRLAPRRTGALRRSITVVNVYDPETKTVRYDVGWNPAIAWYGPLVELGTEDTPAQPHLRPALNKVKGR